MNGETIGKLLEQSQYYLTANLSGVTHEQSLEMLPGGANPINWIAGHAAYWRNRMLEMAGGEPLWNEREGAPYEGSPGKRLPLEFSPKEAFPIERLVRDLDELRSRLKARLDAVTPEDLAGPGFGEGSLGDALTSLLLHEVYHGGQLGVLRRVVGKEGAV